jgi:hypothetical protein
VEKYGTSGQDTEDNVLRRRKDVTDMPNNEGKNADRQTHYNEYLMLSHGNNGYANAPQY